MTCCQSPKPEMHLSDLNSPYWICSSCGTTLDGRPHGHEAGRKAPGILDVVLLRAVAVGYEFEVN